MAVGVATLLGWLISLDPEVGADGFRITAMVTAGSGSTRSSASITQVLKYSVDLYKRLKDETGLETGWKMTGCLRLACNEDRWIEYKRLATTARSFGMDMHLLSPD